MGRESSRAGCSEQHCTSVKGAQQESLQLLKEWSVRWWRSWALGGVGEGRPPQGKESVNNSQWEVLVPWQSLTFNGNTRFSDTGATPAQLCYFFWLSKMPFSFLFFFKSGEHKPGRGDRWRIWRICWRVAPLCSSPFPLGEVVSAACLISHCTGDTELPLVTVSRSIRTCSSLAFPWKSSGTMLGVGGKTELDLPDLLQKIT